MRDKDLIVQGIDYPFTPTVTGTSYTLGARGIDMMAAYSRASSTVRTYSAPQYPIYDGHGNMTATLYRTSPGYACTNLRSYDVWGGLRSGSSSGDPNTRYCANLGHKQDDESGLIYMRARYYEPGTGRFITEDPAFDGINWYTYCANSPVDNVDPSGTSIQGIEFLITFYAFIRFSRIASSIGGAGTVEAAYGEFVKAYKFNVANDILGIPEAVTDALDIFPSTLLITIGMRLGGFAGAVIGSILCYFEYATRVFQKLPKFALLMLAHGIRMNAYVEEALGE